jgi:bifunctional NMN adenylyltransferase/nudix hydrolase
MDFDVLAFAGRFQPFHNGHKAVVDEALRRARKVALVLGSHDQPRDTRNPFTTAERIEMISAVYPHEVAAGRIAFVPVTDYRYNDQKWIAGVQTGVTTVANTPFTPDPIRIGLIGHSKDHTSWYLKAFPMWGSSEVPNKDGIDATTIRCAYLSDGMSSKERGMLPPAVARWLDKTVPDMDGLGGAPWYKTLQAEQEFILKYRQQWAAAPYAPTFLTVDALVIQSGHILLVKRGALPGKGLWALPGGFLEQTETLVDGAVRELMEETQINLSEETLKRCITRQRVFDDPHRSQRGRTVTTAFLFELRPDVKLTKVKGGDDAAKAKWVPLSEVKRSMMFEDHFDIISEMTGAV